VERPETVGGFGIWETYSKQKVDARKARIYTLMGLFV
jgi:hypothetical protein